MKLSRSEGIITADLDGEVGMMLVEKGEYIGLDAVGTSIWEFLKEPTLVLELVAKLLEKYDIDKETCLTQTVDFLQQLSDNNLIQQLE